MLLQLLKEKTQEIFCHAYTTLLKLIYIIYYVKF